MSDGGGRVDSNPKSSKRVKRDETSFVPSNNFSGPMLTDMYQITMTYAHWKGGKADEEAVFDLFFRKCPFAGEFCIFAGLDEVVKVLASFKFTEKDIVYLRSILPVAENEFFEWLQQLDCSKIRLYSVPHGCVVFSKEPLIRIEGPLCVGQLLETVLLNLVNYPSLVATNAARMRLAAGKEKTLLEFGLRRAQGPDGGFSASKYSYLGGFDGSSNITAGRDVGIPVKGTHAHAYVMSYKGLDDLKTRLLRTESGEEKDFVEAVMIAQRQLDVSSRNRNMGELAAFISYAQAFPNGFLALIDTYDTVLSGVENFICVGAALHAFGYQPLGVRLDSGDLNYLSHACRKRMEEADEKLNASIFCNCKIVASDDLDESKLLSLATSSIDTYGIGTNLVTCSEQPALGCVYKLVELSGKPCIKLSNNVSKMVIPFRKEIYRLYGSAGHPVIDLMITETDPVPVVGKPILCKHPYEDKKRVKCTPAKVESLLRLVWDGAQGGIVIDEPPLQQIRSFVANQLDQVRADHIQAVNPVPYKVSVSEGLYDRMHKLWEESSPLLELS